MVVTVYILGGIGLLLSAGLVLIVGVPVTARGAGSVRGDEIHGAIQIGWLLGLVGVYVSSRRGTHLTLLGRPVWKLPETDEEAREAKRAKRKAKKEARRAKKQAKAREGRPKKTIREWLRWLGEHRGTLARLGGRLTRTFRLRLRIEGVVGLGDPADTAALLVALRTLTGWAESPWLDVEPDFLEERVELDGDFEGRLWILAIGWVGAASLFEWRTWKLLRGLV